VKWFGNLDNLALGMGLSVKPKQVIPAKHATLEGFSSINKSSNFNFLVFIAIVGILYILSPKGQDETKTQPV
jgi:hypothetical protein